MDLVFSTRLRLTAVGTLVAAAVLTGGALWLTGAQHAALVERLDATLSAEASAIELSLAGGIISAEVADPRNDERVVQIVDILNRVVASSPNLEGEPPIADWTVGARDVDTVPLEAAPYRVVTIETTRTSEPLTVHVGSSLGGVTAASDALQDTLVVAVPLMIILFGGLQWLLLGPADPRRSGPTERVDAEGSSIR